MIVNAITVWPKVYEKFREVAHDPKYLWAIEPNYEPEIDKNKMQFAVLSKHFGSEAIFSQQYDIDGYIEFSIAPEGYISNVYCIAFENTQRVAMYLIRKIRELFDKFEYYKICWDVAACNPARKRIEKIIGYFGGSRIGIRYNHRRYCGKLDSIYLYEITRDEYCKWRT